jgi:hypothetical protein
MGQGDPGRRRSAYKLRTCGNARNLALHDPCLAWLVEHEARFVDALCKNAKQRQLGRDRDAGAANEITWTFA